jgi:uncharacterized protein YjgD (DUF1641 family)
MAEPIEFKPKEVDPRKELQRRLEAAPLEHAESILVALDVLEAAHQKGILGLVEGAISSKNAVIGKVAEYAKQPECTNTLRNLLAVGKLLGGIDPERVDSIVKNASDPTKKPPSLFRLLIRSGKEDVRRGLSVAMELLGVLGSR